MARFHVDQSESPPGASSSLDGAPGGGVPVPDKELGGLHSVGEVRLLVADADQAICRTIQSALAQNDYTVDAVSDPAHLKPQLQVKPYHVIILDYVLPGLEAAQVFHWLHQYQPQASVVVVTAFPSLDSALMCLRAHAYDYLTKPIQIGQLEQVITRCLESKGLLRISEEALRESLGSAIRERRKGLGLTLAQMSQRTSLSLGYLSQIELGKNSASIETLYRISLGLGIKMADLFQSVQASL